METFQVQNHKFEVSLHDEKADCKLNPLQILNQILSQIDNPINDNPESQDLEICTLETNVATEDENPRVRIVGELHGMIHRFVNLVNSDIEVYTHLEKWVPMIESEYMRITYLPVLVENPVTKVKDVYNRYSITSGPNFLEIGINDLRNLIIDISPNP